jgi:hypothetical protein
VTRSRLTAGMATLLLVVLPVLSQTDRKSDPFSPIPEAKRTDLKHRLSEYVETYRARNWAKLYGLVSNVGRGDIKQDEFVFRMEQAHGTSFANNPDLLKFTPARSEKADDGFDVYGCGEAQREGGKYKGVAVVHAVFEHDNWFFTGWSFDGMASGSCEELREPDWEPFSRMPWNQKMEELR